MPNCFAIYLIIRFNFVSYSMMDYQFLNQNEMALNLKNFEITPTAIIQS
jgi:hypothetical protein